MRGFIIRRRGLTSNIGWSLLCSAGIIIRISVVVTRLCDMRWHLSVLLADSFSQIWGRWICKELNLQGKGVEIARKGIFKKKAPQFAPVWICKEWIYPGNQEVEFARNSICKERNLQLARNGLCKEQSYGTYLWCEITLCYLLPDASERAPP